MFGYVNCIQPTYCGNHILEYGEECDDGNTTDDDMCTNHYTFPVCGDGIVTLWLGEVCDDGINDGTYSGCGLGCSYLPPYCGDAIVDTYNGEDCDDGFEYNVGNYGGCTSDCKRAPYCGDGIVQPEYEQCDGGTGCTATCTFEVD